LAKKVKGFWFNALKNCRATAPFIDSVDEQTLQHLEDVTIDHDEKDVRDWEITFVRPSRYELVAAADECPLIHFLLL
jgi:hypothetical protein